MNRFKNILLMCEDDCVHDELVDRAINLGKQNNASITLVDVIDAAPGELARAFCVLSGNKAQEVEHEVLSYHASRLANIAAPFAMAGLKTQEIVLQGVPYLTVIRKVINDGHDLVMKGVSGKTDGNSLLFASTDMHLLRKCPCPVWIVKPSDSTEPRAILAAVESDLQDEQRHALNTLIMDLSTSLAEIDRKKLLVVNAWRLAEEETLRQSGFTRLAPSELDLLAENKRQQCDRALDALLTGYCRPERDIDVHLVKGNARDVIPDFAAREKVDMIVMGTVGRTGISGVIIGNTAESILNRVRCSVLAVKPPAFETPVRAAA